MMFRTSVLLIALVFNAPIIWQALGPQTLSIDQAVIRFIITVPVAAVLVGLVRIAGTHHEEHNKAARAQRTGVDSRPGS